MIDRFKQFHYDGQWSYGPTLVDLQLKVHLHVRLKNPTLFFVAISYLNFEGKNVLTIAKLIENIIIPIKINCTLKSVYTSNKNSLTQFEI